ncbi:MULTISPECIES: NAD(P)H-binding protein [Nocardia]|uniref:NAD(P)H-binding protein n=1 Tax=Nocardia TaxID=1817 RepID=UPI00030C8CF0|nr:MULTISPECIES: NAD(P)H-binding protein [Nocardia]
MILVTGSTGTVGRAVIDHLLAAGEPVRALTRRPDAAALPPGVEVIGGDPGRPDMLSRALRGVSRVFLLSSGPELAEHDRNIVTAAARAGAERVVKLSSGRAGDSEATDPIPAWHRAGERAVVGSGLAWTILRPLGFMSNALHWAPTVREHDTVYAPYGHGRIAVIDPADIAAVAVAALVEAGHDGRIHTLSGPQALTPAEQTGILSEVLGRPLRYVSTEPAQAHAALLGAGVDEVMADAIMALRATALDSFTSVIHPDVERITGRPARTFREWARDHRADFE